MGYAHPRKHSCRPFNQSFGIRFRDRIWDKRQMLGKTECQIEIDHAQVNQNLFQKQYKVQAYINTNSSRGAFKKNFGSNFQRYQGSTNAKNTKSLRCIDKKFQKF